MSPVPEIRFLVVDRRRLAYEVTGEGPLLLCPAWWVSHLGLDRGNEAFAQFWEAIGDGFSLVRYDRLGVGVSDRELRDEDLSLDGEVEVIGALLDELGAERVGLLGGSSGGCAASHSQRVFQSESSVCCSTAPTRTVPRSPRRRCARRSSLPFARTGAADRGCCQTPSSARSAANSKNGSRGCSGWPPSAVTAARLLERVYRNDVRDQLPLVKAPTMVVHRRKDRAIPHRLGREVAAGSRTSGASSSPKDSMPRATHWR